MAGTLDFERARLRGLVRSLRDEVQDFALDARFKRTLERAARRLYGHEPRPSALLNDVIENEVEAARFFPWAVWDVRHDRAGSIGARFLKEHGADLTSSERALVRLHLSSACRFYEVVHAAAGSVQVRDVSTGREAHITDPSATGGPTLVAGAVVFGRLLETATWGSFERAPMVLSAARFRRLCDQFGPLPVSDAHWRRSYPRLMGLFDEVREAGVEVVTSEGEAVVPCVAVFRHRSRGGALAVLQAAGLVGAGPGAGVAGKEADWLPLAAPGDVVPLGLAMVRGRRLHVTCATIERAGRVRALVEQACGADEVHWLSTVYSNLDFLAIEMLEELRLPEPHVHDPALAAALREVVPEFLAEWWDVPNARLDGETPRETVDHDCERGRRVRAFLASLERVLGAGGLPAAAG